MARRSDQMKLCALLPFSGMHVAAWRHPEAHTGVLLRHYVALARQAEAASFDAVFIADGLAVSLQDVEATSRLAHNGVRPFEPITLLSALAAVTERIGLIATASTSFSEPFNIARQFASLDNLSGGRAGWNLVTSSDGEAHANFGHTAQAPHAARYERAAEFAQVVLGLWDSWDDDAFVRDRDSGRYFEPGRMRVLDHHGAHFRVRGPLNVPRSPQGRPVLVQAGGSEPGRQLAAATAEVVFSAQMSLDEAIAFQADVKGRMAAHGRAPDALKIMPGLFPVVGRTRAEAQAKYDALQALIHPAVGLKMLEPISGGLDLSRYPLDGPLPELPETNGEKARQAALVARARRDNLSIRELYLLVAGARGHLQVVGTASDVADAMEERFQSHGADGFNVMPAILPSGLADFVELVLPELRRRGLFRERYAGSTLREHLGLPRPRHGPEPGA